MSASLKKTKSGETKSAVHLAAPLAPVGEAETAAAYQPDVWGFMIWLGCVGVLVVLHVLDWLNALLGR